MRRSLSGILSRVNSLADQVTNEVNKKDWDRTVVYLQSARPHPSGRPSDFQPMSDKEMTATCARIWEWKDSQRRR
jgi:hypothetical protein